MRQVCRIANFYQKKKNDLFLLNVHEKRPGITDWQVNLVKFCKQCSFILIVFHSDQYWLLPLLLSDQISCPVAGESNPIKK
jgi:hypothetical protein